MFINNSERQLSVWVVVKSSITIQITRNHPHNVCGRSNILNNHNHNHFQPYRSYWVSHKKVFVSTFKIESI